MTSLETSTAGMAVSVAEDTEVWTLPSEGTEQRDKVIGLLSLLMFASHPHIRTPSSAKRRVRDRETVVTLHFPRRMASRSLYEVSTKRMLDVEGKRSVAFQLLSTLSFLHRHNVFYNFLTSDDVLVEESAAASPAGASEAPGQSEADEGRSAAPGGVIRHPNIVVSQLYQCTSQRVAPASYNVTRNYRPPEVILSYKVDSSAVDMWVLGCLMLEIATGSAAFSLVSSKENGVMKPMLVKQQLSQIVDLIGEVSASEIPDEFNARHREVIAAMKGSWQFTKRLGEVPQLEHAELWDDAIRRCMQFNPSKRAQAAEMLSHPLFEGLKPIVPGVDSVPQGRSLEQILP